VRLVAVAITIGWVAGAVARAELPSWVTVAGDGQCPTTAALARALESLHPGLHAGPDGDGDGARVEIVDEGATYRVRAGGSERQLRDAARRCDQRATAAAVAATLLLDPPSVRIGEANAIDNRPSRLSTREPGRTSVTEPDDRPRDPRPSQLARATAKALPPPAAATPAAATPAAATPAAATRAAATPATPAAATPAAATPAAATVVTTSAAPAQRRRPSRIELELSGVVEGAAATGGGLGMVSGGGALRVAVGGRHVAATLGVAGLAPATSARAGVNIELERVPFDVGVRLALPFTGGEAGADVALVLALLRLDAPALDGAVPNVRLDAGARVSGWLRFWLTRRLALQLDAQLAVSFAPYDLVAQPLGVIAATPRLWLGGGAGMVVRF
jgi:hypothetical protein